MTTREIRKDKNNKLSKKQCIMFLTEYEKLLKNEIKGVINPITNNLPINDEKRLNYIVKYCRRTFAYDDNEKKIIEGHINTRDEFTVNINSYDQIMTLLFIPFRVGYRIDFIEQLFLEQDNLDEKTALYLLEKYINENKKNKYIKCYLDVVKDIKKIIKNYHFSMTNEELYDLVHNTDILDIDLITKKLPQQYYFELLVLSKNTRELRKNLCNNLPKYIILRYLNLLLRQVLYKYKETDTNITLVNYLYTISVSYVETGNINFRLSYDSLSLSFSSTESTHSSGTSVTSVNKKEKQLYLDNILSYDGINEVDPFSQKEWHKMNLQTLKTVIIIEYQENGKTFRNAFNAKDLYTQWKIAIKNNKPFVNPYTRKPFTIEDTQMIVDRLKTVYPRIVAPTVNTLRRRDIELSRYTLDENTVVYTLYFRIEDYDQLNVEPFSKTIELLTIVLPIYINIENYEYHIDIINDKIIHLFNTNKITGKTLPFKVHPAFLKYNKKDKLTIDQYKNFCNML